MINVQEAQQIIDYPDQPHKNAHRQNLHSISGSSWTPLKPIHELSWL